MKCLMLVSKTIVLIIAVVAALAACFPLTDTDIWWHLACARQWVTTWTPVREPVVNVHEFFQQIVAFVYNIGGPQLLVAFKAVLWAGVFALFLLPSMKRSNLKLVTARGYAFLSIAVSLLFFFRYQFEIRPVVFSLLFLGVYWNLLPWLFAGWGIRNVKLTSRKERKAAFSRNIKRMVCMVFILALQWFWCKVQGLYILGVFFAYMLFAMEVWNRRWTGQQYRYKAFAILIAFVLLLLAMPYLHHEGANLFPYPFELLDRLLGLSPSATIFASEIAENRSPMTLLMAGENILQSSLMIVLCIAGIVAAISRLRHLESSSLQKNREQNGIRYGVDGFCALWLLISAALALSAERNFVLYLPVFLAMLVNLFDSPKRHRLRNPIKKTRLSAYLKNAAYNRPRLVSHALNFRLLTSKFLLPTILIAFIMGFWGKSLLAYDSMVAYQRVPVDATAWMVAHPHPGRLFNDDRAGGYLALMNPSDSIYIDGRFILKTAEFFENYLSYSSCPQLFLHDAESQNIDRVVLPLLYYARWDNLIATLDSAENWHVVYRDPFFVVMDRTGH